MGGTDRVSQLNAVYILESLIEIAIKYEDGEFIRLIGKKFITLFLVIIE